MVRNADTDRERRIPLSGCVAYRYESAESGTASWRDVSRSGTALELGRYLRPQRNLSLHFNSPLDSTTTHVLPAKVMWCRRIANSSRFVAGLHVFREDPEAALAFAELGYCALGANNFNVQDVESVVRPVF